MKMEYPQPLNISLAELVHYQKYLSEYHDD